MSRLRPGRVNGPWSPAGVVTWAESGEGEGDLPPLGLAHPGSRGRDSGTSGNVRGVDGLLSEGGPSSRTPVVSPEEVRSSGSRRTDPFRCRAPFSYPGWDWPAPRPRVTASPSLSCQVTWKKLVSDPPLLLGHPVNISGSPTLASCMGF